ncbi:MAG TPA: STAS domain-containing protein [Gammaproteobacteria bacterium]
MKKPPKPINVSLEQVEAGRFKITGMLNFDSVPQVWQQSQALFRGGDSLVIDFSGVTHSDSAGLALLMEWLREARAKRQTLRFHLIPAQMLEIARVCGVEQDLPAG